MKTRADGEALAKAMVDIGTRAGRNVRALLTSMARPLGRMAGNALEVHEAVDTLRGHGPADLRELCLALAAAALRAEGEAEGSARERAEVALDSGAALEKFAAFVSAQGGDAEAAVGRRLQLAAQQSDITAPEGGYLQDIDALSVGRAVLSLGGGRERKEDPIDHSVGVELLKLPGEQVQAGAPLLRLWHNGRGVQRASELLQAGIRVGEAAPPEEALILGEIAPDSPR